MKDKETSAGSPEKDHRKTFECCHYDWATASGLDELTRLAALVCQAPVAFLCVREKGLLSLYAVSGIEQSDAEKSFPLFHHAIQCEYFFEIKDCSIEQCYRKVALSLSASNIHYFGSTALQTPQGDKIGTLCVMDTRPRSLTALQKSSLQQLGLQVVNNLELSYLKKSAASIKVTEDGRCGMSAPPAIEHLQLMENAPDAIVVEDKGKIIYANTPALKLLGLSAIRELEGKSLPDFMPQGLKAEFRERITHLLKNPGTALLEEECVRSDGTVIPVEVAASLPDPGDPSLIQVRLTDISIRLKERMAADKSREAFRSLAENSTDMIVRINRKYEHEYANAAVIKTGGFPPEFYIGKSLRQLGISSDQCDRIEKMYEEVFQTRKVLSSYNEVIALDGKRYFHYVTCVPEFNREDEIVSILITIRDITALKLNEQKLIQANKELDRFVYSASHELKSPLKSILGLARIGMKDLEKNNVGLLKEYLYRIEKSVQKLDQTIRDIIEYSSNNRVEIARDIISFEELVASILRDTEFIDGATSLKKEFVIEQDVSFVSDRRRMYAILNNLITNAIRYSDPAKEKRFLRILVKAGPDTARISIEDNGIGIDEKYHDKIFNMFFRGTSRSDGAGLGLYIVKETLHKLEGTIALQSEKNAGTVFTVTVPNLASLPESDS